MALVAQSLKRSLAAWSLLLALAGAARADLHVLPSAVTLTGPRDLRQLLVTGQGRDLTHDCTYAVEPAYVARVSPDGLVQPLADGAATLTVRAGEQTTRVAITVRGFDQPQPVSYRREVLAVLGVGGCNQGACHGTPTGKNGFKLSLRGYDPAADYLQLTRDALGRRCDRNAPDASLILLKAFGKVPHEGGTRFRPDSLPAQLLRSWLAEGARDDGDAPALTRLEVLPGSRLLHAPARRQQLAVLAHFADGAVRDVTRLTVFGSSDNAIAHVSPTGLVEFAKPGEVAVLCRYLEALHAVNLTYLEPKPGLRWSDPPAHNFIDRHVFAKLKLLGLPPSELCRDEEFVRRAHLDLCAVLPTPDEVRRFLDDPDRDRRAKLIDRLLARPEFVDFWTMKWLDVLRSSRKNLKDQGVTAYSGWLRKHVQKNTPLDRVVRELLTAQGNPFEVGPANYFRAARSPDELAESTAQLFLGIRMQCAKCHNHPFERWSQDDYYRLAAFFAQVQVKKTGGKKKSDTVEVGLNPGGEVKHLRTGRTVLPATLDGEPLKLPKQTDRRKALVDWLTAPDNPYFARSVVNRVWYHLLGRGIVDPVDDFRDSNPAANDALLDALAKDFVAKKYDVKHLIRTIMASRTYQLSAVSNDYNRDDDKYFSHTLPKLLTAEQLLDALSGATEVPEAFPGSPRGTRATQLPDGDVEHPLLKSFGRPARDLPCECERSGDANVSQPLQLLNGETINRQLSEPNNRIGKLLKRKLPAAEIAEELYLATLSRMPKEDEARAVLRYIEQAEDARRAWEDVQWSLLNAKEFLFRH